MSRSALVSRKAALHAEGQHLLSIAEDPSDLQPRFDAIIEELREINATLYPAEPRKKPVDALRRRAPEAPPGTGAPGTARPRDPWF